MFLCYSFSESQPEQWLYPAEKTSNNHQILHNIDLLQLRNYPVRTKRAQGVVRMIGLSVGCVCLFVCVFVDTKTSSLSVTGQFMSSTYYVPVRNRKILACTYLMNESVRQGAKKSRLFNFFRSIETTI